MFWPFAVAIFVATDRCRIGQLGCSLFDKIHQSCRLITHVLIPVRIICPGSRILNIDITTRWRLSDRSSDNIVFAASHDAALSSFFIPLSLREAVRRAGSRRDLNDCYDLFLPTCFLAIIDQSSTFMTEAIVQKLTSRSAHRTASRSEKIEREKTAKKRSHRVMPAQDAAQRKTQLEYYSLPKLISFLLYFYFFILYFSFSFK